MQYRKKNVDATKLTTKKSTHPATRNASFYSCATKLQKLSYKAFHREAYLT